MLSRRNVLASFLPMAAAGAIAQGDSRVDGRIVEFHEHWNRFFRAYLGCPTGATEMAQCQPNQGVFEYPEFLKAAKVGRALFDLPEKK